MGFVALHIVSKRRRYDGQLALGYLFWYGLGRAWIEGLRTDSLYHSFFGVQLRVSQVLSIGMCAVGAILLVVMAVKKPDPAKLFVYRTAETAEEPTQEERSEENEV